MNVNTLAATAAAPKAASLNDTLALAGRIGIAAIFVLSAFPRSWHPPT